MDEEHLRTDPVVLVVGGGGFVGSALVRRLLARGVRRVLDMDAPRRDEGVVPLAEEEGRRRYRRERVDLDDPFALERVFAELKPDHVVHLAAGHARGAAADEDAAGRALQRSYRLLGVALQYWRRLPAARRERFRFQQVSANAAHERARGDPDGAAAGAHCYLDRPSSATRTSAAQLARAWHASYGLPTIVCGGTDTYGPLQPRGELVPAVVASLLGGTPLTVHGEVGRARDWSCVDDHAEALLERLCRAEAGSVHEVGGGLTLSAIEMVGEVGEALRRISRASGSRRPDTSLIGFADDGAAPGETPPTRAADAPDRAPRRRASARAPAPALLRAVRWAMLDAERRGRRALAGSAPPLEKAS